MRLVKLIAANRAEKFLISLAEGLDQPDRPRGSPGGDAEINGGRQCPARFIGWQSDVRNGYHDPQITTDVEELDPYPVGCDQAAVDGSRCVVGMSFDPGD